MLVSFIYFPAVVLPRTYVDAALAVQVVFEEGDPRDPFQFSRRRKWAITWTACTYTLLVSWALSCYSISIADIRADMGWSRLGAAAGISVCVRFVSVHRAPARCSCLTNASFSQLCLGVRPRTNGTSSNCRRVWPQCDVSLKCLS